MENKSAQLLLHEAEIDSFFFYSNHSFSFERM